MPDPTTPSVEQRARELLVAEMRVKRHSGPMPSEQVVAGVRSGASDNRAVTIKRAIRAIEAALSTPQPRVEGEDAELVERLRDAVTMEHSNQCSERDKLDETALGDEAASRITSLQDDLAEVRGHISEQIEHVQTRIDDGKELGAPVWRIALEDVVRENRALLARLDGKA